MTYMTIKMILMQILGLLIPFGGCAAVMSHILYRSKHPYKHPKVAKTIWITVTVLGAGLVIGMGVVMLQAMYGFTSKSRIRAANSNAKHVCKLRFRSTVKRSIPGISGMPQRKTRWHGT